MIRPKKLLVVALGTVAASVMLAPGAGAHVTAQPGEAEKGGFSKITFRVPNERPTQGTTQVEVNIPPEHPIRSVSVKPTPGWTYVAEKTPLATPMVSESGQQTTETVSKITWSGGIINPGEFEEFEVSFGPLPEDTDQLVFPALQTYANGEIVRWIDAPVAGGPEPENPAPVVELVAGEDEEAPAAANPDDVAASDELAGAANAASTDDVDSAKTTAIIGIVVGAVALVAAIAALAMRGKRATT